MNTPINFYSRVSENIGLRPKMWIFGFLISINLIVALSAVAWLMYSKERYHENAGVRAINLAQTMEMSVGTSVRGIEIALIAMAAEIVDCKKSGSCREISEVLSSTGKNIHEAQSLYFASPDGVIHYGFSPSQDIAHLAIDITDRDYYQAIIKNPRSGLVFSQPQVGKVSGRMAINLARPVLSDKGVFLGILIASLDLDRLHGVLARADVGEWGAVSIRDQRMRVIVRKPAAAPGAAVDNPSSISPELQKRLDAGVFTDAYLAVTPIDGVERTVGYTKSLDYPFFVNVGLASSDYLAPWRTEVVLSVASIGLLVSFSWFMGLILWQLYCAQNDEIVRRHAVELELRQYKDGLEKLVADRTAALSDATQAAEHLASVKGEFLANMSHEIRTPLNGVLGLAHVGYRQKDCTAASRDTFAKILSSGRLLLNIVNDILDLSKIESGKLTIEETEMDVNALMHTVASLLQESARSKLLEVHVGHFDAAGYTIVGDSIRIQQALMNYMSNAIKFTEVGSVSMRCLVDSFDEESVLVRFEVQDTGVGIEPSKVEKLFMPFEQADNSITRRFGGTGLGLAITKKLAEIMGGSAGVVSAPGIGSTFWFTVRLKKGEPVMNTSVVEKAPDWQTLTEKHAGKKLLLVEDEMINREIAAEILGDIGFAIECAENGAVAVAKASETKYDLILMDMQMPVMDGIEAAKLIRLMPGYIRTPILAVSANVLGEDREACLDAGMVDFIPKPVDPDLLFEKLLYWLGKQQGASCAV